MHPQTVLVIRQVLVGAMVFTFFGLLISSIWFGTRVDALTIDTITITGGETIEHAELETKLRQQLQGNYLGIVPKVFAFTYPEKLLYEEARRIDRIKDISITRSGGKELVVSFSEYTPHALWCRSDNEADCLFLDETGFAFGVAPSLQGGSLLRVVAIGRGPEVRTQAFPRETYTAVHDLIEQLATVNWFVSRVDIDSADDAFMQIVGGGEFKVSLKTPAAETLSNLQTILASADFNDIKPGNFQYIDLRFGSKVFVNEDIRAGDVASSTEERIGGESQVAEAESVGEPDEAVTATMIIEEPVESEIVEPEPVSEGERVRERNTTSGE